MRRRAWIAGGVAAAAAGAGVALWRGRAPSPPSPADDARLWTMTFERPEGGILQMAALRGQPLLVNFWATWCPPCVKEMPLLDRFHRQHGGRWQVVGLAIDNAEPVRAYLARLPMSFPIGLAGMEGVGLSRALGNHNGGLPFSVVFDRTGAAVERKLGPVEAADLERWSTRRG